MVDGWEVMMAVLSGQTAINTYWKIGGVLLHRVLTTEAAPWGLFSLGRFVFRTLAPNQATNALFIEVTLVVLFRGLCGHKGR